MKVSLHRAAHRQLFQRRIIEWLNSQRTLKEEDKMRLELT